MHHGSLLCLGQLPEDEVDDDVGFQGSAVELQVETFMGVSGKLEPKGTGVAVFSLRCFREDNQCVFTCWETDGVL